MLQTFDNRLLVLIRQLVVWNSRFAQGRNVLLLNIRDAELNWVEEYFPLGFYGIDWPVNAFSGRKIP
jgi:hypothetical protein